MNAKRKKSYADISAQVKRLLNASTKHEKRILNIDNTYKYAILDHFRATYGFTDRMYYKPLTRRVYAGY